MIYTVFSTTDSPYMQWQSELLEYSWKKVGQPGELIRLVARPTTRSHFTRRARARTCRRDTTVAVPPLHR